MNVLNNYPENIPVYTVKKETVDIFQSTVDRFHQLLIGFVDSDTGMDAQTI